MKIRSILEKISKREIELHRKGNIPFLLLALKKSELSRSDLVNLISKRYQLANMFEGFLKHIMQKIEESTMEEKLKNLFYQAVYQNYLEETTVSNYGQPHWKGRKKLLIELGINYNNWVKEIGSYEKPDKVCIAVKTILKQMKRIVNKGPIEALTALWYYENRISLSDELGDYYLILNNFEKMYPEFKKAKYTEEDALWHIASHAEHDTYHSELAIKGLEGLDSNKENKKIIKNTCEEMRKYFYDFWGNLFEINLR